MNVATIGFILLAILELGSPATIPTKDDPFAINVTMNGFQTTKVRRSDLSFLFRAD